MKALGPLRGSPSTAVSFTLLGAKGWKGVGVGTWVVECDGGAGHSDVLQEVPPHACHTVLPLRSFCQKAWDQGERDGAAGAGRGW